MNIYWTYALFNIGYQGFFKTGKFTSGHEGESEKSIINQKKETDKKQK